MSAVGLDTRGQDLAEALLDLAGRSVMRRRAAEVEDLLIVGAWAEVHSTDPRRDPRAAIGCGPRTGSYILEVRERRVCASSPSPSWPWREVGVSACERDLADVLDLTYRLPQVWAVTLDLACPVWLARKVSRLTRSLPVDRIGIVDRAVAAAIATEAPGRLLAICEAKVIEADPTAHAARVEQQRRRRYVALSRADELGLRHVFARVEAGDAVWVDAMVDRVADLLADLLADRHPGAGRDELRSTSTTRRPTKRSARPARRGCTTVARWAAGIIGGRTHAGYRCRQVGTTRWVWRSPHARYYLVDHHGTHRLAPPVGALVFEAPPGVEIYPA